MIRLFDSIQRNVELILTQCCRNKQKYILDFTLKMIYIESYIQKSENFQIFINNTIVISHTHS